MTLHAPQIIMLALLFADVGFALAKHGEPRDTKHNVYVTMVSAGLTFMLLRWGGFFSP